MSFFRATRKILLHTIFRLVVHLFSFPIKFCVNQKETQLSGYLYALDSRYLLYPILILKTIRFFLREKTVRFSSYLISTSYLHIYSSQAIMYKGTLK